MITSPIRQTAIAFAGRRIDAQQAKAVRFPPENIGAVREALKTLLVRLAPRLLVTSAACGSDLLVLDVATELRIETVKIVLPLAPEVFRRTSVTDRPNAPLWGGLYDRSIAAAREGSNLVLLGRGEGDPAAYAAASEAILDEAAGAARRISPLPELVAVIAWEGASRGADDLTDAFRKLALEKGFRVEEVSTLRRT